MTMRGERQKRRKTAADQSADIAAALADVTCSCGNVYEGQSAYQVHRDDRIGCLSGDARGQLVRLKDGRWGQRGRHPELS